VYELLNKNIKIHIYWP